MSSVSNLASGFPSWQQVPFTDVLPSLNSTYFLVDCICWWEKRELMFLKPVKKAIKNIFNVVRGNLFHWKLLRKLYLFFACDILRGDVVHCTNYTDYCPSEVRSPGSAGFCSLVHLILHVIVNQAHPPVLERALMGWHAQYDGVPKTGGPFSSKTQGRPDP